MPLLSDEEVMALPAAPARPAPRLLSDDEVKSLPTPEAPSSAFDAFIKGAKQGFLFNRAPQAEALSEASGMWDKKRLDASSISIPAGPLETIVGGARVGLSKLGLTSPTSSEVYDAALKKSRQAYEGAQTEHPVAGLAGNVVGAITNPIGRAVPTGLTGGAALGAAYGSGEGDTWSDVAKNTVSGGIAGGAIGHVLGKLTNRVPAATQKVIDEADKLGIEVPKYVASPNIAVQSLANSLKIFPLSGTPIVKSAGKLTQQMGDAADQISGGMPVYNAGTAIKSGLEKWITQDSANAADAAYTAAANAMNPTVKTPLWATHTTANAIRRTIAQGNLARDSSAVAAVDKAIKDPNGMTYDGIKILRSEVGKMQAKADRGLLPDVDRGELSRLYGALSSDLDVAAQAAGGARGKALHNRANALYKDISDKREALVSLLGGKNGSATPEQVLQNIINIASRKNAVADQNLLRLAADPAIIPPAQWQQMASGIVTHMGRDAAGNFSPARFIGDQGYNKLSSVGKDVLFGPSGTPVRDNLETLSGLSAYVKRYESWGNPSGTAHSMIGAETVKGALKNPADMLLDMLGARALADAISRPATASAMQHWGQAYLKALKAHPAGTLTGSAWEAVNSAAKNLMLTHAAEIGKQTGHVAGQWAAPYVPAAISSSTSDRPARASGGAVGFDHGAVADGLIRAAKQAKDALGQTTQHILKMPDESVARALGVANASI